MNDKFTCPLCGYNFTSEDLENMGKRACGKCSSCSMICCPNCGYKLAGESGLVKWIKSLFSKKEKEKSGN